MSAALLLVGLIGAPAVDDPAPVRQVIVVKADGWSSQRATLRRFVWDGGWQVVGSPTRAWVGVNGFAPARTRTQNTGTTPAGVFGLPSAFGIGSGSRIRLPYHQITAGSYWPYDPRDPRTYNIFQTERSKSARWRADGRWSERLRDYGGQYRWATVIGYNLPRSTYVDRRTGERRTERPARTDKGGGIFLHVSKGRPTAGCVSVPRARMRSIVRWLDPAADPRIVMGPRKYTKRWRLLVRR